MTTVSIALATFNGERFLSEQLDSLATQTRLPDELIVGDDGSTDATLDILQRFGREAPFPVRVTINRQRLGYAANFLACAERCTGGLIAFCDQDDVWLPHKLAAQSTAFEDADVLLSTHMATLIDADGSELGLQRSTFPLRRRMALSDTNPWAFTFGFTQVFRRALIRFNPYWARSLDLYRTDSATGHDLWLFFLALSLGTVVCDPRPLARYRQHERNVSGRKSLTAEAWRPRSEADRRVAEYAQMAKVAENRAAILHDIGRDAEHAPYATAAVSAAARYAAAAARSGRRHRVYASDGFVTGAQRLGESVLKGDYAFHDAARFSAAGAARDLVTLLTRRVPNPKPAR